MDASWTKPSTYLYVYHTVRVNLNKASPYKGNSNGKPVPSKSTKKSGSDETSEISLGEVKQTFYWLLDNFEHNGGIESGMIFQTQKLP